MGLIRDILFWLLFKCWKISVGLIIIFFVICVYMGCANYWKLAKNDLASYEEKIIQAKTDIARELDVRANALEKMKELNRRKPWPIDPSLIRWSWDYTYWNGVYQGADGAAKRAKQAKESIERGLSEAREGKWWLIGIIEQAWAQSHGFLGVIVFSVIFVPGLWKGFWFYIVAPIAAKAPPIRLTEVRAETIEVSKATSVQEVELTQGTTVCTRGNWVNSYPSKGVTKETRLLWDWHSPLISYASGLRELTEWKVLESTSQVLNLCSGSDPNLKISKLKINSQAGLVVRPGSIIALSVTC